MWPQVSHLATPGRLENGGSVTAFGSVAGPDGKRILATVGGRPHYLQLADEFAVWFRANLARFHAAPTTQVRALAVTARAIYEKTADKDEVPRALSLDVVGDELKEYFNARLGLNDNVDAHVLPTASVASAMVLLDRPPEQIAPMVTWINERGYLSSFAAKQQSALWLDGVHLTDEDGTPETELEKIYDRLLAMKAGSATDEDRAFLLNLLLNADDDAVPLTRKAIIAEALSRYAPIDADMAMAAGRLRNALERAFRNQLAPLELVCLLTAFLIRVHADEELTTGAVPYSVFGVPAPVLETTPETQEAEKNDSP